MTWDPIHIIWDPMRVCFSSTLFVGRAPLWPPPLPLPRGGKGPAGPKTRPPMQEGWAAVVTVPERSPAAVGSSSKYTPAAALG